jgi:predicted transcriptional regulator
LAERALSEPELCNCLALRQATRRLSQYYSDFIAPSGLRGTQYSVLSRLKRTGPVGINRLADELMMDRTTLARNLRPLQRKGLIAHARAQPLWREAQAAFAERFGADEATALRGILRKVTEAVPQSMGDHDA